MRKYNCLLLVVLVLVPLTGCGDQELNTPLVISEVQAGASGDNNYEFIELYNATNEPLDLQDYRLTYRLPTGDEELPIIAWEESAILPPHGHYLLVRSGAEIGLLPDGEFDQALNSRSGGLTLWDPAGEIADRLAWGDVPDLAEGKPAPELENDTSLERKPGGEEGNTQDTNNNRSDFAVNDAPDPQNTGSVPTPVEAQRLVVTLSAPESVEPAAQFDYQVEVSNETGATVHNVELRFTVPADLSILAASDNGEINGLDTLWRLPQLGAGESAIRTVTVETPLMLLTLQAQAATVQASDWPSMAVAAPVRTRIEGGILPIGTARTLLNTQVTIEGIATMYTGGYYAGTNNGKFYIQDETGGIQVQCFDEDGTPPQIELGQRVRVSGEVSVYRNSVQIVPNDNVADVELLGQEDPLPPQAQTVGGILADDTIPGQLVAATGEAIRIEEFTYSYEVDLADEEGNVLLIYVDKLTEMELVVEAMDVGRLYTIAGIAEMYDDLLQLKPRIETDLAEVFAPELMVQGQVDHNGTPGDELIYTFTVFNHTDDSLTNVTISSTLPAENAELALVEDGGIIENGTIYWTIETLPAHDTARVHFRATVTGESGRISVSSYMAWADEWPDPVTHLPLLTFIGDTVPIYAIQGPGAGSPYKLENLTTKGTITARFPELGGFYMQSAQTDGDPATSEALFVYTGEYVIDLAAGDLVQVHGRVRERGSQTELHITAPEDIQLLESGHPLPDAIELDPPADEAGALAYYEPFEGMLVTVPGPALAVSPINHYGEYALVLPEHGVERVLHGDPTGLLIRVDDGSEIRHEDGSTLPYPLRAGDQIENLTGPLAYTFGQFKIEPLAAPSIISAADAALPAFPEAGPDAFTVATFNMENFFDNNDPHPVSDPPRPSRSQYEWKQDRIVQVILAMGAPTFLGVQEVEHIGILEGLAAHPDLAPYNYQAVLIENESSRGINVGFLVHSDRVNVTGAALYQTSEDLFSRPPLLITATVQTASAGEVTVYIIANHLISKSSGEELTEPRRIKEVEWNVHLVDQILATDPEAYVIVLGDLNDYYDSAPLMTIMEGDSPGGRLVHALTQVDREDRYSYNFQGVSQLLDHILVTPSLAQYLVQAKALHVNADYPLPLPDSSDPHRCADHDPVVAMFQITP